MINRIEEWIDSTNTKYQSQRKSCSVFNSPFSGFYPERFLDDSYFVVVDNIPKPDFPELREVGLGDFIDMKVNGVTYKNTYYVDKDCADDMRLHFHELVHVVQWRLLGVRGFINRYVSEIQSHGYDEAPLELMAYSLDRHYYQGGKPIDVPSYVQSKM
ncbi:MAG: hypothetical protein GYB20_07030 [Oceanospirillales bacterium]|nr:hypothetical protein [Oceanospirillales bacterium]MBR9887433.1 hypothetical protein [Oceanospirillales bacterium]